MGGGGCNFFRTGLHGRVAVITNTILQEEKQKGLKISGNRSYGGKNPPSDLNITEIKGSKHPKKSFGMSLKEPGELFLQTS